MKLIKVSKEKTVKDKIILGTPMKYNQKILGDAHLRTLTTQSICILPDIGDKVKSIIKVILT